jgi:chromosome partitioning protein
MYESTENPGLVSLRSLVISSQKGGVGKTTVSLHVAYALVSRGYQVLLVDSDPQGAIGLSLTKNLSEHVGLSDYVEQGYSLEDAVVQTRVEKFNILPFGNLPAYQTEHFNQLMSDGGQHARLLQDAAQMGHDIVVIDTPAGFGGVTVGAMRASTHVLVPMQAEPIAFRSFTQMVEQVGALKEQGYAVDLAGFLVTMLQLRQAESADIYNEILESIPENMLFDVNIPRDPVFLEATAAGVPVGLLRRPTPPVAHVFDLVAAELESRLGLVETREFDGPTPLVD